MINEYAIQIYITSVYNIIYYIRRYIFVCLHYLSNVIVFLKEERWTEEGRKKDTLTENVQILYNILGGTDTHV